MNNATRTKCFVLVFALLLACVGCVADTAQQPSRPTSAKTEAQLRREERAKAAEELKDRREAAAKSRREAAAKAKQEASAKAKAEREEQTKLARLDAKVEKQAQAEIAQAEREKRARLAGLDAKIKKQNEELNAERANIKRKFEQDKAKLTAEYEQAKALAKKDKAKLDAEYNQYQQAVARLEAEHKTAAAKLDEKAELAKSDKEQVKKIKTEKANLERKLKQDKKELEKSFGLAKLAADYMEKVALLEANYMDALSELEEKETAKYATEKKQIEDNYQEKVAKVNIGLRLRREAPLVATLELPEDTTSTLTVRALRISGNSLISTAELFKDMPSIYNASDKPLQEAERTDLFDLRILHDIIIRPGQPRQVSTRTIQGFTQYLLSVYQNKNYAGIYVYVPSDALKEGRQLEDEILPINILEASVSQVTTTYYNPANEKVEKGLLSSSAVIDWSPAKVEKPANQKELDDFVNLLNLNPDRYVSAIVSQGAEPNSIAVGYNIYEANPWHWFIQADNSGTSERQWNPRVGVINTNLLGIDDRFTAIYQAPWDSTLDENYGVYGSYDLPLLGPRLRLNLYGGYSEFDISPESGPFDFLGRGTFYGGILRYNLFQDDGWFFDIKGSLEHTKSKVTPSLFPSFLGTNVRFWLWGGGIDLHRSDDISQTSFGFNRYESLGGESGAYEFNLARTNAETDFAIYTASAAHSQYLDSNKVERLSGSFRYITSDERLVPAKMTSFGGMYSVRGYDEYEAVADGGILASVQYEFDLVKYEESKDAGGNRAEQQGQQENPFVRKLAPLVFFDYGRAKVEEPVGTDRAHEELFSIGGGGIVELGDNFSGVVYYGYPLNETDTTRKGKGHVHVGVMMRW
ncbi:MAG TPA: ShlB/FhaC/HecB family hemolysin secretion/activation protein [Sedimentisphaerales bacterium]|nr:ShlB/FhaC/HecB family hemolysin secretion/activation protein [Sedimentisphaerales bacterium]